MADKILHKRSSTPSAVPSAASLELGELALNTADGRAFMKKSNGSVVEIGCNGSAFFSLATVTATSAGQTSFTIPGGYTPGAIVVFLNGSSLAPAHYTATNGTTVVLGSGTGVAAGSELVVLRLTAFEVANALPLGGTAADSSKLGGQLPSYYAEASDIVGAYKRSNILGTVSQAGGVPTGALIERGNNANGEYVRFADGSQKCLKTVSIAFFQANTYYNAVSDWPAAFSVAPRVLACIASSNASPTSSILFTGSSTAITAVVAGACNAVNTSSIVLLAEGRWF